MAVYYFERLIKNNVYNKSFFYQCYVNKLLYLLVLTRLSLIFFNIVKILYRE